MIYSWGTPVSPKLWLGERNYGNPENILKCSHKLYRKKLSGHVEQAPSPALEKNSRGRLFHIFSSTGVVQNGHESLACEKKYF
jgi:hypothetical protein